MPKFRKKPVVIEAVKWNGIDYDVIAKFENPSGISKIGLMGNKLIIRTLEGMHTANKGDWIIRGVKGEFYPCKPDIFLATYERVD